MWKLTYFCLLSTVFAVHFFPTNANNDDNDAFDASEYQNQLQQQTRPSPQQPKSTTQVQTPSYDTIRVYQIQEYVNKQRENEEHELELRNSYWTACGHEDGYPIEQFRSPKSINNSGKTYPIDLNGNGIGYMDTELYQKMFDVTPEPRVHTNMWRKIYANPIVTKNTKGFPYPPECTETDDVPGLTYPKGFTSIFKYYNPKLVITEKKTYICKDYPRVPEEFYMLKTTFLYGRNQSISQPAYYAKNGNKIEWESEKVRKHQSNL